MSEPEVTPTKRRKTNEAKSPERDEDDEMRDFVKDLLKNEKSFKTTPKKKRSIHHATYEYHTIEEILNLYPIKETKYVAVYGVIRAHDSSKGILSIMDQTRKCFSIYINHKVDPNKPDSERLPLRPGDIIRIHRLGLYSDFTRRCPYVRNVVIFESFKDDFFKPVHLSANPTIADSDREKVQAISEWNTSYLLARNVRQTKCKLYYLCDTAFQVLCSFVFEKRIILVCWNGNPFEQFPCYHSIGVQQILEVLSQCRSQHIYTEDFIKKIYDTNKLVFISVYGIHRTVALALKPLDTIIVYNLLIKSDKFYYGMYSYLVFDGLSYGRTIRVANYNSEIAQMLSEQIEEYFFLNGKLDYNNYNFDKSQSQIMSHSKIFDTDSEDDDELQLNRSRYLQSKENQQETTKKTEEEKPALTTFIEELDESSLNNMDLTSQISCTHIDFTTFERTFVYKHLFTRDFKSHLDSIQLKSFKDILEYQDTMQTFKIQARFHSFVFQKSKMSLFSSLSRLRKYATVVQCTSNKKNRQCDYRESFEKFVEESKDYRLEEDSLVVTSEDASSDPSTSTRSYDRLKCPQCSLMTCIVCLDFYIILQDYDGSLFLTHLSGPTANRFFSCCTADLCQSSADDICQKIPALLKYLAHITNDNSPCNQKIYWIIEQNHQVEREYNLIDACILSSMVSCGVMTSDAVRR